MYMKNINRFCVCIGQQYKDGQKEKLAFTLSTASSILQSAVVSVL